jgi:hypothetical protein
MLLMPDGAGLLLAAGSAPVRALAWLLAFGGFEVEGGGNWWIGEAARDGVGEIGFAGSKRSIGYIRCERDLSHPIGNGRLTIIGPVGPKWALLYSFFA